MKPKTKTRKSTKAITLLTRIEALLSDVLVECSAFEKSVEKNVRGLLRTAEASIAAAKDYFAPAAPPKARQKAVKKPARRVARTGAKPAAAAKRRAAAPAAKRAVKRAAPVKPQRAVVARQPENAALPVPLTNIPAPAAPDLSALG